MSFYYCAAAFRCAYLSALTTAAALLLLLPPGGKMPAPLVFADNMLRFLGPGPLAPPLIYYFYLLAI